MGITFKESTGKPTIKALEICVPQIIISPLALDKMKVYVDECRDEVGWLGTAVRDDKGIYITDTFLFDQEVSAVTTDITEEGLSTFAEELLKQPNGVEIWNNIKVWGHSHVNMATSPSRTDENQMETFVECGHDWFIRIIANKNGSLRIDLFDYALGVIYSDMPWQTGLSEEEVRLYNIINESKKKLKEINSKRMATITDSIVEEIKQKVRKKTYQSSIGYNTEYNTEYTNWKTNYSTIEKEDKTTTALDDFKKKGNTGNEKDADSEPDLIMDKDDIEGYFTQSALIDIGECATMFDAIVVLEEYGYEGFFSHRDIYKIWKYAGEMVDKIYLETRDI